MFPASSICDFPLIAGADSKVIISSLEIQVQKYNNIDEEMRHSFAIGSIHGTQNDPLRQSYLYKHSLQDQILI